MNIAIIIAQYLSLGLLFLYGIPVLALLFRSVVHNFAPDIERKEQYFVVFSLLILYIFGVPVPYHG